MSSIPLSANDTLLADAVPITSFSTSATLDVASVAGNLSGTAGNDTLNGGTGADQIFGLAGNDILNGRAGNDLLNGGDGNDTLTGGTGDDQLFGEAGDDRFVWNAGDGNDVIEGGNDTDRLEINGDGAAETTQIVANGARVFVSTTNGVVTSNLDIGGVENLVVSAGGGNDTIVAGNGLATLTNLTLDGGAGNDTILGGDGNDVLLGGGGNDFVDGNRGNDTASLGDGDDVFGWDPGDGSDTVEGNGGTDTLQFNGSNANEQMVLSASGSHALLTRDVGLITMDLHGMETVNVRALGGTDSLTIGDLRGTDVKQVHVDLAPIGGGDDGAADTVTVALTAGNDALAFNAGATVINGLGAQVFVENQGIGDRFVIDGGAGVDTITANGTGGDDTIGIARDGTDAVAVFTGGAPVIDVTNVEQLLVKGGAGNDTLAAQNGIGTLTQLTLDGGIGNDTILGGDGNDVLLGGSGNDFVDGNIGSDTASLGDGDDVFGWDPGDGSDTVEGNGGTDTLQFNGSNIGEDMALFANGSHAVLTRNIAAITMDLHSMENVNIRALGSADNIVIGDLRGTDVKQVHVDLAATGGGDDGAADTVTVALTAGNDALAFNAGATVINGLGAQVSVDNMGVGDRFVIDGGAGIDTITANGTGGDDTIGIARDGTDAVAIFTGGAPVIDVTNVEQLLVKGGAGNDTLAAQNGIGTLTQLTLDGGTGNDTILGGDGNDVLLGGSGNDFVDGNIGSDTASLGDGDDVFGWDPGDGSDTVEGNGGTDTLQFNGSNIGEDMALFANGSHAVLTRNIAAITMDLHSMENVNIRALGSADNIVIGDLRGTDVDQVHVDLSATGGGDDGAADTVTVAFTAGDDTLGFTVPTGAAVIDGLGAQVSVDSMGVGDHFVIDGGTGNDTVTANGSGGDDVIGIARNGDNVAVFTPTGSAAIDVTNVEQLLVKGGDGNDTLAAQNGIGTLTQLTLDGGAGNDTIRGGDGNDILLGGGGNDFVDGNIGSDTASLGDGDDVFGWDPGDGSDTVEGNGGTDTLQFNGSNIGEDMALFANGSHAVLTRNIAAITMDLHSMENVNIRALGSTDAITVGDMSGTDVKHVNIDLSASTGGGDGANDVVAIQGTNAAEVIHLSMQNGALVVDGLAAQIVVQNFEAGDQIQVFGLGGDDVIDASALPVGASIVLDGGEGDDVVLGGDGNDMLLGGAGDDVLIGGPGFDALDGGSGDNILIQDGGNALFDAQLHVTDAGGHTPLLA